MRTKRNANQICDMVEFFVDNIFVKFGGHVFRRVIGIPMGTNCFPLLADLFLYSYQSGFSRQHDKPQETCFRYIDDLIVFNNIKNSGNMSKTSIPPNFMLKRLTSPITWQATLI